MIQVRTLAATLAIGASVLGSNAWGALCDSSSMSLGGITASCQELTGGANASFPGLISFDVPAANTAWRSLVFDSGDSSSNNTEFGMTWSMSFPFGTQGGGSWSLTGTGGSVETPVDILAFIVLDTGSGQLRDEYLAFYIAGPTWAAVSSQLSGQIGLLDGNTELETKGVYIYGAQRTTDPGTGGRAPEPASIALLGALGLGFLGARRLGRRG